jgi:predicted transcriptional regulator
MARPRNYEEKRIATAVRLPESIYRRLHEAASDRDVSANLLVIRAVSEFLDQLPTAQVALHKGASKSQPAKLAPKS